MTGPNPFFGLSCWPGARAGVTAVEVVPGRVALSVYLDPMSLVLNVPPYPGGDRFMAGFMRDLARTADDMADQLDTPTANPVGESRHALRESGESGWFGSGGSDAEP